MIGLSFTLVDRRPLYRLDVAECWEHSRISCICIDIERLEDKEMNGLSLPYIHAPLNCGRCSEFE
jgi:hypothetical protein